MTDDPNTCDICGKPITPGDGRYGASGDGGLTGPILAGGRHYDCHINAYGKPRPNLSFTEVLAHSLGSLRK